MKMNTGQALIEFALGILILITLLAAGAGVLRAQWNRTRCAYLVFERTFEASIKDRSEMHSDRIEMHSNRSEKQIQIFKPSSIPVIIDRTSQGVRGTGFCGGVREVVELPDLESANWSGLRKVF